MAGLCSVSTLFVVLLVFWTADGLLLTKTRVRRDARRSSVPRRILVPSVVLANNAHDHITDMIQRGQASHHSLPSPGQINNMRKNQPVYIESPSPASSPTTNSSSTAATTNKTTESTTSRINAQNELPLRKAILAERLIPRTFHGNNVSNYDDVGLANITRSDSAGIKVTIVREDTASETKISKQFFQDGVKSQLSCNLDDPNSARLVAGCGDYYLFPGYNVKLVADASPCTWRFRYTAPDVIISSKGRTSKHDFGLVIQEATSTDSQDANATAQAKERYGLGGLIPRDLVIELQNNINASEVPVQICVPTNPQNAKFDEYGLHDGVCCHTTADTTCGIPNGFLDDENFGRESFPWEAVLSVTMKPANSDEEDTTYCSGTLISEEWVLTTAACILRPKNKHTTTTPQVSVSFAEDTRTNDPVSYGVKEYIIYPTSSETHDITLVRLDRKSIRSPVCLPPYNKGAINEGVINQKGIVFGWVLPAGGAPYMSTRNQQVISSAECAQRLGAVLPPHVLCSVDKVTTEEPCLADGHLLTGSNQFTLQGLSTPRLACKDDLRQHSSIEHFMPWISSITGIKMRN